MSVIPFLPTASYRLIMHALITVAFAAASAVLVAGPAAAFELEPRDFSTSKDVPIRVVSMRDTHSGVLLVFAIANRTSASIDVAVKCSLYNAEGQAIGTLSRIIRAVPPKSEAEETSVGGKPGTVKAVCRVTETRSK